MITQFPIVHFFIHSVSCIACFKDCFHFRLPFHPHSFHIFYYFQRSFPVYLSYDHIIKKHHVQKDILVIGITVMLDCYLFVKGRGSYYSSGKESKETQIGNDYSFPCKTILISL